MIPWTCRVFDIQKKKFMERLRRVYIWADLDKVEDDKLDFLAVEYFLHSLR